MNSTVKEISTQALNLPPKSRAILADILLDSLEEVNVSNNDKAWIDEAVKRNKQIEDGSAVCRTRAEVMDAAYKAVGCKK